jgi:hypothetical protein
MNTGIKAVSVESKKLFAVYLGGQPREGRMGEDHEVVFVVAQNPSQAKKLSKSRWRGDGAAHIDSLCQLEVVDGWRIYLEKTDEPERLLLDPHYHS